MKVLFICGREPEFTRNRVIQKALAENKIALIQCSSSSKSFFWRTISICCQFFLTPPWRYQAIVVGFFGHPIVFVVKPYSILFRKPILFDAFVSAYDTMVWDRQRYPKSSFRARSMFFLDRWACLLADHVLLDTDQNIEYWVKTFRLPKHQFSRVFFGADDDLFCISSNPKDERDGFVVEFHGSFQPLQGVETILKAAALLSSFQDIRFQIIGEGPQYSQMRQLAKELRLKNVEFLGRIPAGQVVSYVQSSDVGLGVFGKTRKAMATIPNKAFEIAACGKPLITADTPAAREFFEHGKSAYLCPPQAPEALVSAIKTVKEDESLRKRLGKQGYEAFVKTAKPLVLGQQIKKILYRLTQK